MGSLKSFHDHLKDLQSRARKLAETATALNELVGRGAIRLEREDEAARLKGIQRAIVEQLRQLRAIEAYASCGHGQAKLVSSLIELGLTAIFSKGNRLSAITDCLLNGPCVRKQPFGLVMVCIGPKGLPDDVNAVSISQLAGESGRPEPEVMDKLRNDGYLLLTEEAFSILVDEAVNDILGGKLQLPASSDKLVKSIDGHNCESDPEVIRLD